MASEQPVESEDVLLCDFQFLKCPKCGGMVRRTWHDEGELYAFCDRVLPGKKKPCGTHMEVYSEGGIAAVVAVTKDESRVIAAHKARLQRLKVAVRRKAYGSKETP